MSTFSRNFLKIYKALGLSYAKLEELTGISDSSLQRYAAETTKNPPASAVTKIEKGLNLVPGTLLGLQEETSGLSDKEAQVISAYRNKPNLQPDVDRLLGIENSPLKMKEAEPAKVAAFEEGKSVVTPEGTHDERKTLMSKLDEEQE